MQFVAIIVLAVAGGAAYGILHDQVTVRVCLEYFTIGHPPIFHTQSPTLLAIGWGIIATLAVAPWVIANIPEPKRMAFMADWWAHSASYLSGVIGAAFLCAWVWKARRSG